MREKNSEFDIPGSQKIFGNTVYWVAIAATVGALIVPVFILACPSNNVLNPALVFRAIFEGAAPAEIWAHSASGEFPGAHFYLDYLTKADSWGMIFCAIGISYGIIGLVPAVLYQAFKEKDWFCAILGSIIIVLIFLSLIGVLSVAG